MIDSPSHWMILGGSAPSSSSPQASNGSGDPLPVLGDPLLVAADSVLVAEDPSPFPGDPLVSRLKAGVTS